MILHFCPANGEGASLALRQAQLFESIGGRSVITSYDPAFAKLSDGRKVEYHKGGKWEVALRVLGPKPDADYIALWDDDIDPTHFDPGLFLSIMRANELDVAQPSIKSVGEFITHPITAWRDPVELSRHAGKQVVGRLTSFVEIMVPVFTRQAWTEICQYIPDAGFSGWGLDYVPFRRRGIVDATPVNHTRRPQSTGKADLGNFMRKHYFMTYHPAQHGYLAPP